jgi:hypothetical protein
MKPLAFRPLLLAAALLTPALKAQDAPAKIREIEQRVLMNQYHEAVRVLVEMAGKTEGGKVEEHLDVLGRRVEWVATVGNQIEGDKMSPEKRRVMTESARTLNDLAWSMIIQKDADARHPEVALKLVTIALELSEGGGPLKHNMLDTKARALFLLDKRDEAIAEQEKAVAAATIPMDKAEMEATLASYRKGELPELSLPAPQAPPDVPSAGTSYILSKLRTIVLPSVDFEDTTLEEAAAFLRKQSIELDATELDPARKGLNIVVRHPVAKKGSNPGKDEDKPETVRIKELHLRNVPLAEALKYICEVTRYRYKVDDFAITLVSSDAPEDLFNRTFRVPRGFGSSLVSIQDLLKLCGVKFDEGASAVLVSGETMIVVNTPSELDKIEALIEADVNARAEQEAER